MSMNRDHLDVGQRCLSSSKPTAPRAASDDVFDRVRMAAVFDELGVAEQSIDQVPTLVCQRCLSSNPLGSYA